MLAADPVVQAIAAGRLDGFELAGDAIQFAAAEAYERSAEDPDEFWDAVRRRKTERSTAAWSGTFGAEDIARVPAELPRLHALFPRTPE